MPTSAAARPGRLVVGVLVVALLAVGLPAGANPSSTEVRDRLQQAEARLDEIEEEVSAAVEEYNQAGEALEAVTQELAAAEEELLALAGDVAEVSASVATYARRLHKLGPTVEFASVLIAQDPTEAGTRVSILRRVLGGGQADLEGLEALRTSQAAVERRLAHAQVEAEQRTAALEDRRVRLEATLAAHETEVAGLRRALQEALDREEAERRRRDEERRRRAAEQRRQQEALRQSRAGTTATTATSAPATRRSAQAAVDTALAQLGKPYRYGGSGPGSFDCSGLTSFAWRAAGVSLPRSSRAQFAATTRISRSDLQPGDLVFYHSPISHVAMYIGGGRVVEAPYSGNVVRIRNDGLTRRGVVGYGRP